MPLRPIKYKYTEGTDKFNFWRHVEAPVFLWLVERMDPVGYDEFSAILVMAESKEQALAIQPYNPVDGQSPSDRGWPKGAILEARAVGTAMPGIDVGQVILADYRAG